MPLTGKYLKYSPEITLEIFTLVWNKLIDCGWKPFSNQRLQDVWKYLTEHSWNGIRYKDGNKFIQYKNDSLKNLTETTIQEILGYDPFVKDDFVLPEKWCIKRNSQNHEVINEYINKNWYKSGDRAISQYNFVYKSDNSYGWTCDSMKPGDCIEITFEQFKKYVLKESTEEPKVIEKDWSKATEEELFEEAKRRYPIGCHFNSFNGNKVICKEIWHSDRDKQIWIKGSGAYNGICFKNGKWAEIISLPETKVESKEIIPEYVECIKKDAFIIEGVIYKVQPEKGYSYNNDDVYFINNRPYFQIHFKPSTKEAFDEQNQPKSIEKWSVGSYVVLIKGYSAVNIGEVHRIGSTYTRNCIDISESVGYACRPFKDSCQWFATKSEAEEFAKTLVEPVKEAFGLKVFPIEGCCKFDKHVEDLLRKNHSIYESSKSMKINNVKFICWNSEKYWYAVDSSSKKEYHLNLLEPFLSKQPLKQAVHCKTQEEWDFVTEKLNYKWPDTASWTKYGNNTCINLECLGFGTNDLAYTNYQILSFQEWCDLNGYKIETNQEFIKGKWYLIKTAYYWVIKFNEINNGQIKADWYCENKFGSKVEKGGSWGTKPTEIKELSIEEIQQYLPDNHPDKIKSNQEFKVGDWVYSFGNKKLYQLKTEIGAKNSKNYPEKYRHATPEEINNHLISIGQIPAEKYPFKKLEEDDLIWEIKTEGIRWTEPVSMTNENWKPKMILSTDDEELPMVNIIKTNTIKQLLNND